MGILRIFVVLTLFLRLTVLLMDLILPIFPKVCNATFTKRTREKTNVSASELWSGIANWVKLKPGTKPINTDRFR